MKSTNTNNIKTNSTSGGLGAIRSATRSVAGNERNSIHTMSTISDSKNSNENTEPKDGVNKSSTDKNSDNGEYSQDREANFAARLASNGRDMAYIRGANLGKNGISPGAFASSSSSSLGAIPLASPSWSGTGAVASSLSSPNFNNNSLGLGMTNRPPSGTATLDKDEIQLLDTKKGDGNFSVMNSTLSAFVSWMTNNGNYLTQTLIDDVVKGGKALGEVFNEIYRDGGKTVGGNSQTLNVNGNKLDNNFGKEGNKASHAVFLADLNHGQHGHMFKADYENFKAVALASGVPADKIKVVDNWNAYKTEITEAAKDADSIKERDGDKAQLGLLTGTAAHGYSFGGRGKHDPDATSGFNVNGWDVKEKQIEDLIGMADAHFNNTLMINCPCHSGGFDGKTDLVKEGRLTGTQDKEADSKKPKEDKQPEKIA